MFRTVCYRSIPAICIGLICGSWHGRAGAQGVAQAPVHDLANESSQANVGQSSVAEGLHSIQKKNEGSFRSYGPVEGMDLSPQAANPFIGWWKASRPMADDGGKLVIYAQYLPDGRFRTSAIVEGGALDGSRMQVWGNYSIKHTDQNHYELTFTSKGSLPITICQSGGTCRPNPIPTTEVEKDEMLDPDRFRCIGTSGGVVTEIEARRSEIPAEMETAVAEAMILNPVVKPPVPNNLPFDDGPNGCNNRQQYRICAITDGTLYTDKRGCKVCAAPSGTIPKTTVDPKAGDPK